MYCVIQTVQRKKPDKHGAYREYEVCSTNITFQDGRSKTIYSYYPRWEAGCFERDHLEAYKISVHESRREGGKVVKKQCVIATIGYYSFTGEYSLYDYIDSGIQRAAEVFGEAYSVLYDLVESKVQPLAGRIVREFHKTEEYKAVRQREKLKKEYQKAKKAFAEKYGVDPSEYDCCYDIYGTLREKAYLNEIIRQQETRRSYRNDGSSNYGSGGGGYSIPVPSTYGEEEKALLREFYRVLAKKYHPDLNPDSDTTVQMQLLNKLKDQWGV